MKKILLIVMTAALALGGCGKSTSGTETSDGGYRDDVSTQVLVEAVASELGEEYWADMELAPEYLDDWYGVSGEMYEEYYGQTPMISANVDSLIIVKATDEHLEDVQNALNNYKETMVQDSLQYPANVPKIQASRIETYGNYVCYVQLGAGMNDEHEEEGMLKACQEANERALEVIEKELTK